MVRCRTDATGFTLCEVYKKRKGFPIAVAIIGILSIVLLFSIRIKIGFPNSEGNASMFSSFPYIPSVVLALLSIVVGTVLGMLYMKYRKL